MIMRINCLIFSEIPLYAGSIMYSLITLTLIIALKLKLASLQAKVLMLKHG